MLLLENFMEWFILLVYRDYCEMFWKHWKH